MKVEKLLQICLISQLTCLMLTHHQNVALMCSCEETTSHNTRWFIINQSNLWNLFALFTFYSARALIPMYALVYKLPYPIQLLGPIRIKLQLWRSQTKAFVAWRTSKKNKNKSFISKIRIAVLVKSFLKLLTPIYRSLAKVTFLKICFY